MVSRARLKFKEIEPPRMLSEEDAAHYLGIGASTFSTMKRKLEKLGFPRQDPALNRRDRNAIDRWLDVRAGLLGKNEPEQAAVSGVIAERLASLRGKAGTKEKHA